MKRKSKLDRAAAVVTDESVAVVRMFAGAAANPVAVADCKMCLSLKLRIATDRVPVELLPVVYLLAAIAELREVQIVDDFLALRDRLRFQYAEPAPGFWHPEGFICSALVHDMMSMDQLREAPDATYMFTAYERLTAERRNGQ